MTARAKRRAAHRNVSALWLGRASKSLIGVGLILILTAAYTEFVEPYFSAQGQQQAAASIQADFAKNAQTNPTEVLGSELADAQTFGVLYAPRLGADYRRPIAHSTSVDRVLNPIGVGHYKHSAMPHESGNFALAAHRTTHGGAFNNIDQFVVGDKLFVETRWGWYGYEVVGSAVVEPKDFWVVGENPLERAGLASLPGERLLTLTTCTPRYTAEKRLVVWAKQVSATPRAQGAPSEIADLILDAR
jgi:sortase A